MLQKHKITIDESRTDEIDIADVFSAVRLINKGYIKKETQAKSKYH